MSDIKILIVEDEPVTALDLQKKLEKMGFVVTDIVSTGDGAISKTEETHPDLILMDIMIEGGIDGIETAKLIRRDFNIPVIYLSALTDEKIINRAKLSEPFAYLFKPFNPRELKFIIEMAVYKHKLETELKESELKYRTLFDNAGAPITYLTLDGTILLINTVGARNLGGNPDDFVGKSIFETLPNIADMTRERMHQVVKTGKGCNFEDLIELSSGNRWFYSNFQPVKDASGDLFAIQIVSHEITGLKRAEEALRKSEEKYRNLVVNMNHIIFAIDRHGKVTYVNPAVESITGYTPLEVIDREITDFIPQEDLPFVSKKYQEILFGHTESIDHRILTRSGEIRFVSTYGYPIYEENEIIGIQGIITDITGTKLLQDQIIRSEQLAATGQLAASIAHEINSPLQGIVSLLHSVKRSYEQEKKLLENLDLIESGFGRIRDTVKNLLDLNRPGKEKKQPININRIIENTVSLVQSILKKNSITVNLNLSSKISSIIASPKQLSHVFLNLINNAVEAITGVSKSNGRKKRESIGGEITINTNLRKDHIFIKVADTGSGIPEKDMDQVFDLFYTRKKTMGMGVGLSICHGIVQDHNGTIVVKNSPKGGAVFTIRLPTG